jgi:hypothetical protein
VSVKVASTPVHMQLVKSSNVEAIGYDEVAKELHVRFSSGGHYVYSDVAPHKAAEFWQAQSLGAHLAKHIKSKHKASRL